MRHSATTPRNPALKQKTVAFTLHKCYVVSQRNGIGDLIGNIYPLENLVGIQIWLPKIVDQVSLVEAIKCLNTYANYED